MNHPLVARRHGGSKLLGKMCRNGVVEHRGAVGQLRDLLLDCTDDRRV